MTGLVDFSSAYVFPINDFGGRDKKEKINYNGENYMIKFRKSIEKHNDLTTKVSNNVFSEYISCHIIETLGIPVQETLLGIFNNEIVVACKDFRSPGISLQNFSNLENSFLSSTKIGAHPDLNNVLKIYEERLHQDSDAPLRKHFWDLFIVDALLGNFDRHAGNWGFLFDEQQGKIINYSPVFDCGSCLYPQINDEGIKQVLHNVDEINKRVYTFPNSSLMLNGEKINYFNFINSLQSEECTDALLRIFPKINMNKICDVIDETPLISSERKMFYKTLVSHRFEKILAFSYEKALDYKKQKQVLPSVCSQTHDLDQKYKTFVYTDNFGDNNTVKLVFDMYRDNNNLFIGLESYDEEFEYWEPYCDVTVNVGNLPFLESAININLGGQEKIDFLIKNGFGELTDKMLLSGFNKYPVFKFNPKKLKEIDDEFFKKYALEHGQNINERSFLNNLMNDAEENNKSSENQIKKNIIKTNEER